MIKPIVDMIDSSSSAMAKGRVKRYTFVAVRRRTMGRRIDEKYNGGAA